MMQCHPILGFGFHNVLVLLDGNDDYASSTNIFDCLVNSWNVCVLLYIACMFEFVLYVA